MTINVPAYYHVGFTLPAEVPAQAVQDAIEQKCIDWLRYATNCYVVWTNVEAATLAGSILSVPGMSHTYFFIIKLDMSDGFGWLPQWIWEWLNRDRTTQLPLFTFPTLPMPPSK
jgi:hypothetical protein